MTNELNSPRWPEILEKIHTRGFWELVVRPETFQPRLDRTQLLPLVEACQVRLRGWDFPHIERHEGGIITKDWFGQAHQFEHSIEHWRMYTSGQFVSVCGVPHEWRDESSFWPKGPNWKPNDVLGTQEATFRMVEFATLARRLAESAAGSESMYLRATLGNAAGRTLVVDSQNRAPLRGRYTASVDRVEIERVVNRAGLADVRTVAQGITEELFGYFGWKPDAGIVPGIQEELLRSH